MSISQAEKGYNKDHLHVPQINLALLCSADTGLPAMIRSILGSVRDIATLYNSIKEIDAKGKTLILDRGFFPMIQWNFLKEWICNTYSLQGDTVGIMKTAFILMSISHITNV